MQSSTSFAGKSWTLSDLFVLCRDEEKVLAFLKSKNLLKEKMTCPKCGWIMKLYGQMWKCCKTIKTKKGKKICSRKISINKGSWFSKSKLGYGQILKLTYMLVHNYGEEAIVRDLKMNRVSQWNIFVKRVILQWLLSEFQPLGGKGKTVEIGDSKFVIKKSNRGESIEERWVFGGVERGSKKMFLVQIEDKSSTTLIKIIKERVLRGTVVISDSRESYKNLAKEGYEHITINNVITGAHINTLRSMWRHIKEFLPICSRKKYQLELDLGHFLFSKYCEAEKVDLFDKILSEMSKVKFEDINYLDSERENEGSNNSVNKQPVWGSFQN